MKTTPSKPMFWCLVFLFCWPVHALGKTPSTHLQTYNKMRAAGVPHAADELLIRTARNDLLPVQMWAKEAGCTVKKRLGKRPLFALICRRPLGLAIEALQERKEVLGIEASQHLDLHVDLPDDWSAEQWHHQNYGQQIGNNAGQVGADIDTPAAWAIQTGRKGPVVAILDTGVRLDHEDLKGQIWRNVDELCDNGVDDDDNGYVDDCFGWDVGNSDNLPDPLTISEKDIDGDNCPRHHGTFIAGLIGARGNNATGTVGVCWTARLMVLKKTRDETCVSTSTEAVEAAAYALDNGADILSMSFGARFHSAEFEAILSEASDNGLLLVTSAGNDGHNGDQFISFPQDLDLDHQLVVANSTNADVLAGSSNWGATTVDLAAPGQTLRSTGIRSTSHYTTGTGTSYSSPLVAATGALIWSAFPQLSVDQVQEAILLGVDPLETLDCATSEKCVSSSGRLNVLGALSKAAEFAGETELIAAQQEEDDTREVRPTDVIEVNISVHNIGGLNAEDTIAIADPAQTQGLQNDTIYFGTVLAGMVRRSDFGLRVKIPQSCIGRVEIPIGGQFLARGGTWPFQITQTVHCGPDGDADGVADRIDCAPADPLRFPGAGETCDGIDNDCDMEVDEDPVDAAIRFVDVDGDGYGVLSQSRLSCAALEGYADRAGDCKPSDPSISPDAEEICDLIDNDCDGTLDEEAIDATAYYLDRDGDGHGDKETTFSGCVRPPGYSILGDDCDDADPGAYPNAPKWDADCQRRDVHDGGCQVATGDGPQRKTGLLVLLLVFLVLMRVHRQCRQEACKKLSALG
jgi:subtilisin family serine protease